MQRVALLVITGALVMAGSTACSDDDAGTGERPLNRAEATMLAEVLVSNYEAGGAAFRLSTLDAPGGNQLDLEGQVDWAGHEGAAVVRVAAGRAPTAVGWTLTEVMEKWPGLDPVLQARGAGPDAVLVRSPDTSRRLDQTLAIVMSLAGERADNAVLIAQKPGSAYLRDDMVGDKPVVVLRYGTRNVYWLDADTGDLVRFEASNQAGNLPTVVDILELGERDIDLPPPASRVPIPTLDGTYEALSPTI
jgi:hypothetical protein